MNKTKSVPKPNNKSLTQKLWDKKSTLYIYGRNAADQIIKNNPKDIIRLYVLEDRAKFYGALLKDLAQRKMAYHLVDKAELEKLTESDHHGGICLLVKKPQLLKFAEWIKTNHPENDMVLCLEGVENPHNIGAIMRTAAHFGVTTIMTDKPDMALTSSAFRVAEGGASNITFVDSTGINVADAFQNGPYEAVATSSHEFKFGKVVPLNSWKPAGRIALLLGEEKNGLSDESMKKSKIRLTIPGTGKVESLNVSVTGAIIMAHVKLNLPAKNNTQRQIIPPKNKPKFFKEKKS